MRSPRLIAVLAAMMAAIPAFSIQAQLPCAQPFVGQARNVTPRTNTARRAGRPAQGPVDPTQAWKPNLEPGAARLDRAAGATNTQADSRATTRERLSAGLDNPRIPANDQMWVQQGNGSFGPRETRGAPERVTIDPNRGMQPPLYASGNRANFLDRGAPAQDRDRVPASERVQPPDAFHPGPTVSAAEVNDPNRIQKPGMTGGGAMIGRARGLSGSLGSAGLDRGGVGAAGRFGSGSATTTSRAPNRRQGESASALGPAPNSAMSGATGSPSAAIGSSGAIGGSSSSLLQSGSPSSVGSQYGSPSSTNTTGSGNTLGVGGTPIGGGIGGAPSATGGAGT